MQLQEAALLFISASKNHLAIIDPIICLKEYRHSSGQCALDKPDEIRGKKLQTRTVLVFKNAKAKSYPRRSKYQCWVEESRGMEDLGLRKTVHFLSLRQIRGRKRTPVNERLLLLEIVL